MSVTNRQSLRNLSPTTKQIKSQNSLINSRLNISQDQQDTLVCIWQSYKRTILYKTPSFLYQKRSSTVCLMMQCHRIMKLPIQTLHLSVAILDKVLNTNYQLNQNNLIEDRQIYGLGIACLYSCQKLQKIRNYGISHWLKHLSPQVLTSIGYPDVIISNQSLRRNEAYIMQITKYNLFTSTIFDILLAIWTLDPPNQKQFYFAQYMLEISLFTQISQTKKSSLGHINTASSLSQNGQFLELEQIDSNTTQNFIFAVDIVLAIVNLTLHFFPNPTSSIDKLIKKIWRQLNQQQNLKQLQWKKRSIKQIASSIFEKALNLQEDCNCRPVFLKYSRQANMAVSTLKFLNTKIESTQDLIETQIKGTKNNI